MSVIRWMPVDSAARRGPWRRVALLAVMLAVGLVSVVSPEARQTPPQDPPVDQTAQTFRLRIDSVSVDVIVLDREGNPVRDLTPDEFEVREAGKPQAIESFKFIDVDESAASRPTTNRDILSFEDQRREAARDDTRLLVILLDDYHVRRENSRRVREQLAFFIQQLQPNDLVALTSPLASTTALTFSRNHDATARAIMGFEGRKYDYTPTNAFEERYQMQPPAVIERMRNEITIRALESLAAYMGGLREGRKTLLFVSEGLSGSLPAGVNTTGLSPFAGSDQGSAGSRNDSVNFFNSVEVMTMLRHAFAAANRANTSIYTLDPRGLASSEYDVADNVSGTAGRRVLAESMDTLRSIAGETGGRAFVNTNDPMPGLHQMLNDSSTYYLLGYTSTEAPRDGRFHEIEVRVSRPGVVVRARKGYWAYTEEEAERATSAPRPEAPPDVIEALDDMARAAGPAGYRVVRTWMGAAPRGAGGATEVTFAWESTPENTPNRPDGVVDRVSLVVESADGRVVYRGVAERQDGTLLPAGRASFAAPPGTLQVSMVAEDREGVRIDADDLVYEVPDFASAPLAVSSPAVFRGRTARDIQNIRDADRPVPTATRAFSRTERLMLRFGTHGDRADAAQVAVTLLNSQGESMASLGVPNRGADGRYETVVPLGGLPPGDFIIEIAATSGAESTRSLVAFRVTG
jgi:VWFA-related protein